MSGRYSVDYKRMVLDSKQRNDLFQPRVCYLERIVIADEYTMDPADIAA